MLIDMHCHLDLYPNPQLIITECEKRKMYVLSVTTTPSAWTITNSLANNSDRIRTALGLHPQVAGERFREVELFDQHIDKTRYVGEIGLDGTKEYKTSWRTQVDVFKAILGKCVKHGGRILSIHSRAAAFPVIENLKAYPDAGTPIFHWFSGSENELKLAIDMGAWFSVGPTMLKGAKGREAISKMPRNRVLTETDGPFTQLNDRAQVPWDTDTALNELSRLWKIPPSEAQSEIENNLRGLTASL